MRRVRGRERGAAVVIFALLLTVLLGVSAFAVDIGKVYTERRHDQNTVDAAVMSGLVEGVLGGGVVNDIVAEVRDKVNTTLGYSVPPGDWAACADAGQLHFTARELSTSPVTDCISFSQTFDELRVKLPRQEVEGIFGPAVGFANKFVTAEANAKIESGTGSPPFVALSTAGQGDFVCLRTSSSGDPIALANGNGPGVPATFPTPDNGILPLRPDPCDTVAFENSGFGTLLPWRYQGTENYAECSRTGNDSTTEAVAIGVDHVMGVFKNGYAGSAPEETRIDGGDGCSVAFPNTFEVDQGLAAGELRCALISKHNDGITDDTECLGVVPRFHQGDYVQGSQRFLGEKIDNAPPWRFMRPAADLAASFVPVSCIAVAASRSSDNFSFSEVIFTGTPYENVADNDWDHYDKFDAFTECTTLWGGETAPHSGVYYDSVELFTLEIGESARFAFIPQVYEDQIDSHTGFVHIEGFVPAFMYRMYTKSASTMCDPADPRATTYAVLDAGQVHHAPDLTNSCGANNGKVDRLSSLILACGMVPDKLCNKTTQQPAGLDIYEFRLTK